MSIGISRRNLLKATGLGVAAMALGRAPLVRAQSSEPVDVMIIGSGFGGAVAARRLTENGIRVVLLERGRRWPVAPTQDTFSTLTNPDGRSAWLSDFALLGAPVPIDRYIGVLALEIGRGIAALAGAGVGGGSLVYAGALYQPPKPLFDAALGASVDYDEMDAVYYPRVRSEIGPSPLALRLLRQPEYLGADTWRRMGQRAGLPTRLLDLAVDWNRVRGELAGDAVPSIVGGEFWYGNNSDAKLSLDKNYLYRAEQTGLLEILTQSNVTGIQEGPDGRYRVLVDEIATDGSVAASREYVVGRLFLAAGSLGTSKLLVRAHGRGWLPRLNEEVGRRWGNNGDFFTSIAPLSRWIEPSKGGPVTVAIEDFANPIAPTSVETYADWSLDGRQGVLASVGMSTVPPKGVFSYRPASDDVVLDWPAADPEIARILLAARHTYDRIATAWGASHRVRAGIGEANGPVTAAVTAHPLGGVVLDQATDNLGTVVNYEGLYVVDGALIPGHTGCANPALTIAALAERNLEGIIARDF